MTKKYCTNCKEWEKVYGGAYTVNDKIFYCPCCGKRLQEEKSNIGGKIMSEKFCLTGHKCKWFIIMDVNNNPYCEAEGCRDITGFKRCPWPEYQEEKPPDKFEKAWEIFNEKIPTIFPGDYKSAFLTACKQAGLKDITVKTVEQIMEDAERRGYKIMKELREILIKHLLEGD